MDVVALVLVVGGAILQLVGLWWTVRQIRLVIGIRSTVWRQLRDAGRRLLRRTPTETVEVTADFNAALELNFDIEARLHDESETEWLAREVRQNRRALADLRRKLSDLDDRSQRALDGRIDELNRETAETAKTNAVLMWWGVVLIATGIAAQTVGSLV
ncbi:hypothetical protein AAI421_21305 [Rhodococcus aetherivorans]|uniref:hypothetical protein n=1 Tax=Rhodococcus aetherivorans TaxID=191292 RepID=UPI0031D18A10